MSFWDFHTEIAAIDSGSNYLRIVTKGKLVFNEPNQISIDTTTGKVLGIEHSANKTKDSAIIKPVNYVPADFHAFEMTVRLAVKNIVKSFLPKSLITYWSIPTNITEVDKRAYRDSAEHAYSKETYLVYQATSSAIAMGILFEKNTLLLLISVQAKSRSAFSRILRSDQRDSTTRNMEN